MLSSFYKHNWKHMIRRKKIFNNPLNYSNTLYCETILIRKNKLGWKPQNVGFG